MTAPGPRTGRDGELFRASVVLHVAVCLVLIAFRNLGWEVRSWGGRLDQAAGRVVTSDDAGEICSKGGRCTPVYDIRVSYLAPEGEQVFTQRWSRPFREGTTVRVEHARGRPALARMTGTADLAHGLSSVLTTVCGLGFPLVFGGLVMCVSAISDGERPRWRVVLLWVAGLAVELALARYFYWL